MLNFSGLADLSVDEFFDGNFEDSGSESDRSPKKSKLNTKGNKNKGEKSKAVGKQNTNTKSKQAQ